MSTFDAVFTREVLYRLDVAMVNIDDRNNERNIVSGCCVMDVVSQRDLVSVLSL